MEAKHETESATYKTFVGGLLEFEMPEVPTLNSHLQRFLGSKNNVNNNTSSDRKAAQDKQRGLLHRDKSRNAALVQDQFNEVSTPRTTLSELQAQTLRLSYHAIPKGRSESYTPSPIHSPRTAFVTTEFLQKRLKSAHHGTRGSRDSPADRDRHARGKLLPSHAHADGAGDGRAEEFDEDDLYHTMTEYGLYQELGKINDLYVNKSDHQSKSAKSVMLPELTPY
ncbi:hypothetical protein EGW08_012507 [Elysia chlorotica]|uniref:Uncharacterized protein n=1 Tax=Elysia chlorotica TaxID=188477 RepID=A0A3S1B4L2_ELYCH|nr:hypothetical protein EGW08_012507 [Elysia chlorotica]